MSYSTGQNVGRGVLDVLGGIAGFLIGGPEGAATGAELADKYITTVYDNTVEKTPAATAPSATSFLPVLSGSRNIPVVPNIQVKPIPLNPPEYINSSFQPGSESLEPVIKVGISMRPQSVRHFDSEPNRNPNAAFGTTGFTRTIEKRPTDKIYKVVI